MHYWWLYLRRGSYISLGMASDVSLDEQMLLMRLSRRRLRSSLTWLSAEVVVVACLSRPGPSLARSATEHRSRIRAGPVADAMPQLTGARPRRADIPPRPLRPIAVHCTTTNTRYVCPSVSSWRKTLNKTAARINPLFPHPGERVIRCLKHLRLDSSPVRLLTERLRLQLPCLWLKGPFKQRTYMVSEDSW